MLGFCTSGRLSCTRDNPAPACDTVCDRGALLTSYIAEARDHFSGRLFWLGCDILSTVVEDLVDLRDLPPPLARAAMCTRPSRFQVKSDPVASVMLAGSLRYCMNMSEITSSLCVYIYIYLCIYICIYLYIHKQFPSDQGDSFSQALLAGSVHHTALGVIRPEHETLKMQRGELDCHGKPCHSKIPKPGRPRKLPTKQRSELCRWDPSITYIAALRKEITLAALDMKRCAQGLVEQLGLKAAAAFFLLDVSGLSCFGFGLV